MAVPAWGKAQLHGERTAVQSAAYCPLAWSSVGSRCTAFEAPVPRNRARRKDKGPRGLYNTSVRLFRWVGAGMKGTAARRGARLLVWVVAWAPLVLVAPAMIHDPRASSAATFPPHLTGSPDAVAALLERVLPGASAHFELETVSDCGPGVPNGTACFTIADAPGGKTRVAGTTASELTAGVGLYLREYCNITIGWRRGGGSNTFMPSPWPSVGDTPVSRARSVPYSHVTQVCTHSYTLVWHDWACGAGGANGPRHTA